MKSLVKSTFCALTLTGAMSQQAVALDAPAGLVPGGLTPGQTFFVVFVSDGVHSLCSETAATVNALGDTIAAAGTDTGTITGWTPLFAHQDGTNTTAAAAAFGNVVNRPIYLTNGTKVADDRADMFDGTLDAAINVNEKKVTEVGVYAMTGFDANGAPKSPLNNGGSCNAGDVTATNTDWADAGTSAINRNLYVLSPLLTVPAATSGSASGLDW